MKIVWVGIAALCSLGAGCRQGEAPPAKPAAQEPAPPTVAPTPIPEPTEDDMLKQAPEPLLMEMWFTRPMARPGGYRILADGTWWNYRNFEFVWSETPDTPGSEYRRVPIEEGWYDSNCRLSPDELAKLKESIRTSGVMDLPAETPPSPEGVIGGSDVFYTFDIDGRRHRVHFLEGGDTRPPPITQVRELANRVIFNSQQRWLRDRGEEHAPLVDY